MGGARSTASEYRCGCRRKGFAVAVCDAYWRQPLVADSLVYGSGAPLRIVATPYMSPKTQAQFDWHLARVHK